MWQVNEGGGGGGSYTDEQAQDAVGAMVVNSARVSLTYVDATPSLTADLVAASITAGYLLASATNVIFGRSTTGAGAGEEIPFTAVARDFSAATTQAAQQTVLGLGTGDSPTFLAAKLTGGNAFSGTLSAPTLTANRTWTLPNATANFVFDTVAATLTGKTIQGGVYTAVVSYSTRSVTAAGAITVGSLTDYYIGVNKTSGAATTVNLPATPITGRTLIIKDEKGDAATNNITIVPNAGNIDNAANYVINANLGSVMIMYNGTQWIVAAKY